MNAAIFFEGRNFYAGCKRWARESDVDYVKLRDLLQSQTKCQITHLSYYMGADLSGQLPIESSNRIDIAAQQLGAAGYLVRTFPLRLRQLKCRFCEKTNEEITEKQVDTAMAVDAMNLLFAGKTDLFVFVTSDSDLLPLVQAIKQAGKKVWIVAWKTEAVSPSLMTEIDNVIVLDKFRSEFLVPYQRIKRATKTGQNSSHAILEEIEAAQTKFSTGYVGLHYFLKHWKSNRIPTSVEERVELLNNLFASGAAFQYKAHDGNIAISTRRSSGAEHSGRDS